MNEKPSLSDPPLRAWRVSQGLTQRAFAADLGVASDTVARWDRGEMNPHKKNWPAVQRRTGMSPRQFLHIEATPNEP